MGKVIDMTGWIMSQHGVPDSRLIVIQKGPNHKDRHAQWWCKCTCDLNKEPFLVKSANIRQGRTKSCGCLQKEQQIQNGLNRKGIELNNFLDLTGWIMKQHGVPNSLITVLYKTNKRMDGQIIWHCIDEEGYQSDIASHNLISGKTLSCGCIKKSKGEHKIRKILTQNNISFKTEYKFQDLKDIYPLRFDFYVNNQYLIEYDGIQHFQNSSKDSKWNKLEYYQKHDELKNQYCIQNKIPLIRIPYTIYDILQLKDLILQTSQYRVY